MGLPLQAAGSVKEGGFDYKQDLKKRGLRKVSAHKDRAPSLASQRQQAN